MHGNLKTRIGTVVSSKMAKTAVTALYFADAARPALSPART